MMAINNTDTTSTTETIELVTSTSPVRQIPPFKSNASKSLQLSLLVIVAVLSYQATFYFLTKPSDIQSTHNITHHHHDDDDVAAAVTNTTTTTGKGGGDDVPDSQLPFRPAATLANHNSHPHTNVNDMLDKFDAELQGFRRPASWYSSSYIPRAQPITDEERIRLMDQWGSWTFHDESASTRPNDDFFIEYPNRDAPRHTFPPNAWQVDVTYLTKFLKEGVDLVDRAMEAILAEYGRSKVDLPDRSFEERAFPLAAKVLRLERNETLAPTDPQGGWITDRAWNSLVRRLLHAVMTEDSFVFVTGGHSAATGHGNYFHHSYTMQVQKVLEPVFDRLGVYMEARNLAMGGLGTLQSALGLGDIYGRDIDFLVWDSRMTESKVEYFDLFMRQALLSGRRVPILAGDRFDQLKDLHYVVDADICRLGAKLDHFPETTSATQAEELPYAVQYLRCSMEAADICLSFKYNAPCWVNRSDVTPPKQQRAQPHGQTTYHPGFRYLQLTGRVYAFTILMALREALTVWQSAPNFVVPDDAWHVTSHYRNTQSKAQMTSDDALCLQAKLPNAFCFRRSNGRTEFTPRTNPALSSIRSIVTGGVTFELDPNLYDPPDVRLTSLDVPVGAVDYLNIVENGVQFQSSRAREAALAARLQARQGSISGHKNSVAASRTSKNLYTPTASDNCDGTYESFCGRSPLSDCLLYGHNDCRGGIFFSSRNGWLVMRLDQVTEGVIVLKLVTGQGNACVGYASMPRGLHSNTGELCSNFKFEFSIDRTLTSWGREEFQNRTTSAQVFVELWTLLDDRDFAKGGPRDVELAFRMTGCGKETGFLLTHVYWI